MCRESMRKWEKNVFLGWEDEKMKKKEKSSTLIGCSLLPEEFLLLPSSDHLNLLLLVPFFDF